MSRQHRWISICFMSVASALPFTIRTAHGQQDGKPSTRFADAPHASRRLGKAGICDLCGTRIGADAPCYVPETFRRAVRSGLRPSESILGRGAVAGISAKQMGKLWVGQVMRDTTDWACCPECVQHVERYLQPAGRVNPSGGNVPGTRSGQAPTPSREAGDSAAVFSSHYNAGKELRARGRLDEAIRHYEAALKLAPEALADQLSLGRFLNNLATLYHEARRDEQAEAAYLWSRRVLEQTLGLKDPQLASLLDNLGQLYLSQNRLDEAETTLRRSLGIREAKLPPNHLDRSISLNNMALLHEARGDIDQAETLLRQSLAIVMEAEGPSSPSTAKVLLNLGMILRKGRDPGAAIEPLERTVRILERGDDATALGQAHFVLAEAYGAAGRDQEAGSALDRSLRVMQRSGELAEVKGEKPWQLLAARFEVVHQPDLADALLERRARQLESRLGPDHPDLASALSNLGGSYFDHGRYDRAESVLRRCLALQQAADPQGPDVAWTSTLLGRLYREIGRFNVAEEHINRAFAIQTVLHGPDSVEAAGLLSKLGVLLMSKGDYARSAEHLRRALRILEQHQDQGDVKYQMAQAYSSLASVSAEMNLEREQVELLYERALRLKEAAVGPDHPSVAITLDSMAAFYTGVGSYEKAASLLQRALDIRQRSLRPDHPSVAVTLHSLAEIARRVGNLDSAEALFRRSLEVTQAALGPEHPRLVGTLAYLAGVLMARKQYDAAEELLLRGLKICEGSLPPDHPDLYLSLNFLGDLYALSGRWEEAVRIKDRSLRLFRRHASRVLPALAEPEQLLYLKEKLREAFEGAISVSIVTKDRGAHVARSAEWVLNLKAITLESLTERAVIARQATDKRTANLVDELLKVQTQLANLSMRFDQPRQVTEKLMTKLAERDRELSRELGLATGRVNQTEPWIDLDTVRRTLPPDAVLVEFALFRMANYETARLETPHYAAWMIPAAGNGEVLLIDLGEAGPIDGAIVAALQALKPDLEALRETLRNRGEPDAEQQLHKPLLELARLVLQPLLPHIGQAKRWLISPDAALWLVPWAALPLPDGRYAIEGHLISYLVSGRDLVADPGSRATGPPIVLADPDYDLDPAQARATTRQVLRERAQPEPAQEPLLALRGSSRSLAGVTFARLPGTAAEAELILPQLTRYAGIQPRLYTGPQALEAVFKAVQRPRIVMLSTHGFFLEEPETKPDDRQPLPLDGGRSAARPGPLPENPLLRCGLVLAGANQRDRATTGPEDEDGILTGLEIVGTDLRGTELVVLSACETAVGQVRSGEGVAGLRQAFQLAGARAVVATLWQVPDKESARLMVGFFDNLAAGRSRPAALRDAQLSLIAARRERFGAAHPFFWAAFTLTGQPGEPWKTEQVTDAPASELAAKSSPMRLEDGPSQTRGIEPAAPETKGKVTTATSRTPGKVFEGSSPGEGRLVRHLGIVAILSGLLVLVFALCRWWALAKPGTAG